MCSPLTSASYLNGQPVVFTFGAGRERTKLSGPKTQAHRLLLYAWPPYANFGRPPALIVVDRKL